jgi:broad specificity phosphatase PhoE
MSTRITLVRHGETTGQSSIRYFGATDVPLNEHGEAQMRRVGSALARDHYDRVFTSELQRSRRAAALIRAAGPPAIAVASFNEIDFGRWEGWTREEIAARDPDSFARWQQDGESFTYPGGESRRQLAHRVLRGLDEILATHPPGAWLMVLHRGVIAAILTHLLELSAEQRSGLAIELGSIHHVARRGDRWDAEAFDIVAHLRT